MSGPCHRSLYGYQMRTALALAVEYPHIAVTFLPLACSGATVNHGFLDLQRARECPSPGTGAACPGFARPQIAELNDLMTLVRVNSRIASSTWCCSRSARTTFISPGLSPTSSSRRATERSLLRRGGAISSVEEAQQVLERELPANFARLRAALKPYVGGNLARVVFVTYGNPALAGPDTPCPGGRDGFDVHPAFGADGERLRQTATSWRSGFCPASSRWRCASGQVLPRSASERMTFVDAHQPAFAEHGVCARSVQDPPFDRECFSPKGESFSTSLSKGATDPLLCSYVASEFRPYAPRARWVRTANDSYLTAMTYPEGLPALLQPRDLHDAIWGIFAAVYGGAVHPTAEGHAAMADAALPAVREVLALPPTSKVPVFAEPLDPALPLRIHRLRRRQPHEASAPQPPKCQPRRTPPQPRGIQRLPVRVQRNAACGRV